MTFLSPEIQALAKIKGTKNLIKREVSCGIFQDYGNEDSSTQNSESASI